MHSNHSVAPPDDHVSEMPMETSDALKSDAVIGLFLDRWPFLCGCDGRLAESDLPLENSDQRGAQKDPEAPSLPSRVTTCSVGALHESCSMSTGVLGRTSHLTRLPTTSSQNFGAAPYPGLTLRIASAVTRSPAFKARTK